MLRRDDDHSSSPAIADGIKRPTRKLRTGRSGSASLFGLAPCGVLPATRVATGAVRSYRTFSPLPIVALAGEDGRYIFCATFLRVAPTGRYPAHCPTEFGLSSRLVRLRPFGLRRDLRRAIVWRSATPLSCHVVMLRCWSLAVRLLRDRVLLELLIEVAARRADHL